MDDSQRRKEVTAARDSLLAALESAEPAGHKCIDIYRKAVSTQERVVEWKAQAESALRPGADVNTSVENHETGAVTELHGDGTRVQKSDGEAVVILQTGAAFQFPAPDSGEPTVVQLKGGGDSGEQMQFAPDGTSVWALQSGEQCHLRNDGLALIVLQNGSAGPIRAQLNVDGDGEYDNGTGMDFGRDITKIVVVFNGFKIAFISGQPGVMAMSDDGTKSVLDDEGTFTCILVDGTVCELRKGVQGAEGRLVMKQTLDAAMASMMVSPH
jgi:hypothetical protein